MGEIRKIIDSNFTYYGVGCFLAGVIFGLFVGVAIVCLFL